MNGSTGGGDFLSSLWKLISGGGGTAGAQNYTDIASAMNPALASQATIANVVPSDASQAAASINPSWTAPSGGGSSGVSSKDLVSALQGAGKGVSGMQEQQMRPNVTTPMASSQAVPGRGQDLGTLLQLLQQRNQYGMGSGSTSGGLLGVR